MKTYRDEAIVLRAHKLGEADQILTLLTHSHGQVRAVAKGVRRTSSRFGGRLQLFNYVDVQLYQGRSLDTITQVECLHPYSDRFARSYDAYTRACVMVETAQRLTSEVGDPASAQHLLLLGGLHSLAYARHDPQLTVDSYLLRALAVAGWAPSFYDCAVCGAHGPQTSFSVAAGGAVCDECRPPGASQPRPGSLSLLGALLSGDWQDAEAASSADRAGASALVAAHVEWTMERHLRSLPLVERAPASS